ncbi:MAG: ABC transporter substrate-binding protein [Bacteroidetes bacterium]|nr:ABC transporter substrate-binding protein [Bacteroidota bacterium]MCL5734694.1 ABC transporter substrate-binding protein [Actinomycetota bacterium]
MRSLQTFGVVTLALLISGACTPAAPTSVPTKAPPAATVAPAAAATAAPTAAPKVAAPTATPAAKIKRGGVVTMARTSSYNDMDPHRTVADGPITTMLYDTLLDYSMVDPNTGKHELAPMLAEAWKVIDPKTIEFKLRKGVKFHDGSDWNAEVAKWNIERIRDDKKSAGKHLVSEIETVEIADPLTIRLKLKVPWATLLINLTGTTGGAGGNATQMASKAAVDKGGDEILSTKPVGTGPMVIDQWLRDDKVIMKKWDGYWKTGADGKPLPYLDGFVERVIRDTSVQLVELRSGNIQVMENADPKDVASIKSNPDLVYWEIPWANVARFTFGFNQEREPFKGNVKVRQAAQYAIDRENLAKVMGFGLAKPAYYAFWTPALLGYNENIPNYKFDLAKSKQLLAEAGYPNGYDLNIMVTARDPDRKIGEIVKQMWDTAGIRTTLDIIERLAAIDRSNAGNFQSYFWGQNASPDPDLQSRMIVTGRPSNWSRYSNPELDKCMADGRSVYENQERQKIYERCLRIVQEDALIGSGYLEPYNRVFNKSVKALQVHWIQTDLRETWLDK